ncbi:MAG: MFS transporter [Capsulimonadaceae bacterium]
MPSGRQRPDTNKPAKPASSPEYRAMHVKIGYLAIAVIINVIGFSILIPLGPYYIRQALGPHTSAGDPHIGELSSWLIAVYALMQFLFAPIWGSLSDRIGRKPILIGSLVGDAIFYTLFGLSHTLPMLFGARILAGVFSSGTLSVAQAYVADITPPEHRAVGMGIIGASFGVGFVIGPAVGGCFGATHLGIPLFIAAGLAIINLIYIAAKLPESRKPDANAPGRSGFRLGAMARGMAGPIGYLYLLTFAVTFAFGNLEGTFTAYLMQNFGLASQSSLKVQGWIFTYIGFIIIMVQGGAIRPLVKRYGEANLVVAGIALMAAGFAIFPFAHTIKELLLLPMILISIGNGLNTPALRGLISRKSSSDVQGEMMGLSASFDSLARAVGPAAAGWLYSAVAPASPYWCAAVVMTLSLVLAVVKKGDLAVANSPEPAPSSEPPLEPHPEPSPETAVK